jgi:hypothetical protein
MKIRENVWIPNSKEIVKLIDIKKEWTSYPHGSGTNYNIYTFEKSNGQKFSISDCCGLNGKLVSIGSLKADNHCLEKQIENIKEKIKSNNEIISKLQQ